MEERALAQPPDRLHQRAGIASQASKIAGPNTSGRSISQWLCGSNPNRISITCPIA